MIKKTLAVVALSAVAVFAFADQNDARREATQVVELQNGSTLYVFKDGKMACESKYGKAVSVKKGTVLTAKDGSKITMVGNEVAKLSGLLRKGQEK